MALFSKDKNHAKILFQLLFSCTNKRKKAYFLRRVEKRCKYHGRMINCEVVTLIDLILSKNKREKKIAEILYRVNHFALFFF